MWRSLFNEAVAADVITAGTQCLNWGRTVTGAQCNCEVVANGFNGLWVRREEEFCSDLQRVQTERMTHSVLLLSQSQSGSPTNCIPWSSNWTPLGLTVCSQSGSPAVFRLYGKSSCDSRSQWRQISVGCRAHYLHRELNLQLLQLQPVMTAQPNITKAAAGEAVGACTGDMLTSYLSR